MDIIEKVRNYYKSFSGNKGVYGYSVLGKPLYYMEVKRGEFPVVIIQYAIHGREYITSYLAISQIEYFINHGNGDIYFLPMTNPDGVHISLYSKPLYKANYNGVDLNTNFDARWGTGKHNIRTKGDENFIGEYPFSQPESRALRDFTIAEKPVLTISYHCKGEEIYYDFHQKKTLNRDRQVAEVIQRRTGYTIKENLSSAGGYKDWCIEKLSITALTVEVGSDKLNHPIKEDNFSEIQKKNIDTPVLVTNYLREHRDKWTKNL